jgi:6-pyruvoyltetrahydropterin/6-carboxytetrahydropterin synthase
VSTISVQTHFAAGHRILGLPGAGAKCRNIHGHTFHVTWTIEQGVECEQMVEFGELKVRLKDIIKTIYDHCFILDSSDDFVAYLNANMLKARLLDGPPTTERIAEDIATVTMEHFTTETRLGGFKHEPLAPCAKLLYVKLDEGPENTATWENPAWVKRLSAGGFIPNSTGFAPGIGGIAGGGFGGAGTTAMTTGVGAHGSGGGGQR